jgi:hypothetical protein
VSGIRASDKRAPAAARGGCSADNKKEKEFLTALLPQTNRKFLPEDRIEIESTVEAHPTFFVAIPQTSARQAEFLLLKEKDGDEDQTVYQVKFALTSHPGIVGFRLPNEAPALTVGQKYHWFISLVCNSDDSEPPLPGVEGWVKRVELDATLAQQLKQVAQRDRPRLYADAGIWTDTLTTIAELLKANPNDSEIAEDWESLLESVDLQKIAQTPLVQITSNIVSTQEMPSGYSSQAPNPNLQNSQRE